MKYIMVCFFLLFPLTLQGEEGYASWYGGKFNGRQTANGEVYDMEKLTAAHKTLPFGTVVRVINLKNEKHTLVRINDRGPFVEGRIIDLSRAAAEELDMVGDGVAPVRLEVVEAVAVEKERYNIQVAAYKIAENAYKTRERLEAEGWKVTFERSPSGYIRVLLIDLSAGEMAVAREKLEGLRFTNLLVRKKTGE